MDAQDPPSLPAPGRLLLAIEGRAVGRRTTVLLNSVSVALTDRLFIFLLRLVLDHERAPGQWSTRRELGIAHAPETPSRLRAVMTRALGSRVDLVESDGRGHCRLHPDVVIERVERHALALHPVVQALSKTKPTPDQVAGGELHAAWPTAAAIRSDALKLNGRYRRSELMSRETTLRIALSNSRPSGEAVALS